LLKGDILKKENSDNEKLFFEDLEPNVQEVLIDLIVSVIENRHKGQEPQGDQAKEK
jgi:hypothetical protein